MQPNRGPALLAIALCSLGTWFQACVFTDPVEECTDAQACGGPYPGGSGGGQGGEGGAAGGFGGQGGTGGADPCGGCGGSTPYCDAVNGVCEACLDHEHCTSPAAAQCDGGECVPCSDGTHCAGVAEGSLCDDGTCVECTVADDTACGGSQTCDLLAGRCVDVAAGSVSNCKACSNDLQCESGHKCIPMDFQQSHHGYFCLAEPSPTCAQPFGTAITAASINGVAAAAYCGIEEDLATCEAVLALLGGWHCSGTNGMCSPDGIAAEEPVPGALCDPVGLLGDRCTYACGSVPECLPTGPGSTCGTGTNQPPGWCGG